MAEYIDVAPALLAKLRVAFAEQLEQSSRIAALRRSMQDGGSYATVEDYAAEIGDILAGVLHEHLSSAVLPDGRMYYNIADRVLRQLLADDRMLVSDAAVRMLTRLNQTAGIGIKAQPADENKSRTDDLVQLVADAETYDDVAGTLERAVVTYSQSVADDTLKRNVDFAGKAGLRPRIIRKATGKCCKWCQSLAGTYSYPVENEDVYRRHSDCRCTVDYDPGGAKRFQNVHTKEWKTAEEQSAIESRKQLPGLNLTTKVREEPSKPSGPENVLLEYLRTAQPGKGAITLEDGYKVSHHAVEIKTAQWLHENLGGDIVLLSESFERNQKRPDYLWRSSYWELKSGTSSKSADSSLRSAVKQIREKPGGIILDFANNEPNLEELARIIKGRLSRSCNFPVDILILQKGKLIKALRYTKK